MTRHRQGAGHAFNHPHTRELAAKLAVTAAANAKREACSICGMSISTAGMTRHVDLVHGDDA